MERRQVGTVRITCPRDPKHGEDKPLYGPFPVRIRCCADGELTVIEGPSHVERDG